MTKSLKNLTAMLTASAMVSCSMASGMVSAANVENPAVMKASKMMSVLTQQGWINSDVDGNGAVTAADITMIQKSIIGLITLEAPSDSEHIIFPGDANCDGIVSMMDCFYINKYLMGESISGSYTSEDKVKIVPDSREISVSPWENNEIYADYTISNINGSIGGMKAKIDISDGFYIKYVDSDCRFMWNETNNEISMFDYLPQNELELYIVVTADPAINSGSYTLKLTDIEIIDAEGALVSDANIAAEPVNINFEEPVYMTTTTTAPMVTTTTTTDDLCETTTTTAENLPTTTVTTAKPAYNDKADIVFDFGSYTANPGDKIIVPVKIDANDNPVAAMDVVFAIDSPLEITRFGGKSPACGNASVLPNVDALAASFTSLDGSNPIIPTQDGIVFNIQVKIPEDCADGVYKIGFGDKCAVFKDGTNFNYTTAVVNGDITVNSVADPVSTTTIEKVDYTTTTTTVSYYPDYTETTANTTEPIDYTTTSCPDSTTVSYYPDYTETTANTTEPVDYTTTTSYPDSTTVSYYPDYTTTTTSEEPVIPEASATTTAAPDYTTTSDDTNNGSTTTTTAEDPVMPEASATTTAAPSEDLPQTGMPIARAVEGLAVILTISGTALIVKSRRESDET